MTTPIQHDQRKQLMRAVITLVTLDKDRRRGTLDEAGLVCLQDAEDVLSARSQRAVATAFLDWIDNPVRFDPRPRTTVVDEASKPPPEERRMAAVLRRRN